jgi:hypothetical protein
MLLKLNQAQEKVLSDALVQYLQGAAAGQGIAGDNVPWRSVCWRA